MKNILIVLTSARWLSNLINLFNHSDLFSKKSIKFIKTKNNISINKLLRFSYYFNWKRDLIVRHLFDIEYGKVKKNFGVIFSIFYYCICKRKYFLISCFLIFHFILYILYWKDISKEEEINQNDDLARDVHLAKNRSCVLKIKKNLFKFFFSFRDFDR